MPAAEAAQYLRAVNPTDQLVQVRLPARDASKPEAVERALRRAVREVGEWRVERRSLDARKRPVIAVLTVRVSAPGNALPSAPIGEPLPALPADAPRVAVVGMGPAGLYAALDLVRAGMRPVIVERGGPVRERRRDLVRITREHHVDPDSNYCFGEGGAGTYSDGKLYTRSHKRGDIRSALETLVQHGADPEILVESHPHIGTNKLPGIIERMRSALIAAGSEVHFRTRFTDWETGPSGEITTILVASTPTGEPRRTPVSALILATGHSARDVFKALHEKGLQLEAKPFALGVRVEHPQAFIDRVQYHGEQGDWLPPAAYKLVCQIGDHGVHSFCMCPGGIIAPCATAPEEVVTNGWSPSKRNNPFANSGMVVTVREADWRAAGYEGPLAAMHFQADVERAAWDAAGQTQRAPAQRLLDFVAGRPSRDLPACSYLPGVVPADLNAVLPPFVAASLRAGFEQFGRSMKGFLHPDAIVVAPESRTSSPVRIPRDPATLQHPDQPGLFPCGEGAGYAGGILSAALDGQRVAAAVVHQLQPV